MAETEQWTNINDSQNLNFARLTWHCFIKGVQVGSVIGCAVVAPVTIIKAVRSGKGIVWKNLIFRQVYSMMFGTTLSIGMMLFKYNGWENKKLALQDRAYRIGVNKNQNRVDLITGISFAGSFLPTFLFSRRIIFSIGLTSPAIVGGLIFHILTKQEKAKQEKQQ